ncbi:MAG: RsmE family RNA methyltransferase [Parabacteroides sp.]|nr:RsmE family RNA methyltransferase [Parabacteroides sp.]
MQQYFIQEEINGNDVPLNEEILHHMKVVLRKSDGYKFRLCDVKGQAFLAELKDDKAFILERLEDDKELPIKVTVVMSLIKNERFDFCLQKLTELGVYQIVPYMANRSIIKIKDAEHKLKRYRKIVQEAAEQSLRTSVPYIPEIIDQKGLANYLSTYNYVAYEKNDDRYIPYADLENDVTIIIGPEGGFEEKEIEAFKALGFQAISLGKRILRAETAALYVMANIAGANE